MAANMSNLRKYRLLLALLAIVAIVAVALAGFPKPASAQAGLPAPANLTAEPSGLEGEIKVSWDPVPGATGYLVCHKAANQGAGAWRCDGQTTTGFRHSGLEVGAAYDYAVQAFWAQDGATVRSGWVFAQATAEAAEVHFCPVTGLPIPAGGYLGIGGTAESPVGSFTLTGAAAPAMITLPYADNPNQLYSPRAGRRFVQVCGTFRHDFNSEDRLSPRLAYDPGR